jgi:uroporphyrinogen decarboxylase
MKPRERVEIALNHEIPDRCPMYVLFTPDFANRLREDVVAKGFKIGNIDYRPVGGRYPHELDRLIGSDLLVYDVGWATSYFKNGSFYKDEWGVKWREVFFDSPFGKGRYTEVIDHPLANDNAISTYRAPDPTRSELYSDMEKMIRDYQDDYWIVGGALTTSFECAKDLRGFERILMDIVQAPDIFSEILNIAFQYHLTAAKIFAQMGVDMIWFGDDVGGQKAMLMSPSHWKKFLKPLLAQAIRDVKFINPNVKVAYHSDGNITAIIPDLIDIGLDVLNPIQPAAMDVIYLKKTFGKNLSFWGSIDQQKTLPFGTPRDVNREVKERIQVLGKQGGFILSPAHRVQLDTPMENFWAMVNTVRDVNY